MEKKSRFPSTASEAFSLLPMLDVEIIRGFSLIFPHEIAKSFAVIVTEDKHE
jgi:hypothetical protein